MKAKPEITDKQQEILAEYMEATRLLAAAERSIVALQERYAKAQKALNQSIIEQA